MLANIIYTKTVGRVYDFVNWDKPLDIAYAVSILLIFWIIWLFIYEMHLIRM